MKSNKITFILIISGLFFVFAEALTGGEPAKPGEFPHAVQLSFAETGELFCGGSIISSTVILTAAHCLYSNAILFALRIPATEIKVTAGNLNLRGETKNEQIRTVESYAIHPEFNLISINHDVALLFLTSPLDFTENVKPISLPAPDVTYSRGILAGWGYTDGRNLSSNFLKKANFELDEKKICDQEALLEYSSLHVTGTEICSKPDSVAALCKGDSGSGLVCLRKLPLNNGSNEKNVSFPVICGIASWSRGSGICGEQKNGSVFLDVSKSLNWIHYEIKMLKIEKNSVRICFDLIWEDSEIDLIQFNFVTKVSILESKLVTEFEKMSRKISCVLYCIPISVLLTIFICVYWFTFINKNCSILVLELSFSFTCLFLYIAMVSLVIWLD